MTLQAVGKLMKSELIRRQSIFGGVPVARGTLKQIVGQNKISGDTSFTH